MAEDTVDQPQRFETKEDFLAFLDPTNRNNLLSVIEALRKSLIERHIEGELHAVGGMVTQEGTLKDIDVALDLKLGNSFSRKGTMLEQALRRYNIYKQILSTMPEEVLDKFEFSERPPYRNQEFQSDSMLESTGTFELKPKEGTAKPIEILCSLEDKFSSGNRRSILLDTITLEENG